MSKEGDVNARWRILSIPTLALLAAVIGCSKSQMVALQPLDTGLSAYDSVVVAVEPAVAEDVQMEQSDLEAAVVSKIKDLKVFQSIKLGDGSETSEGMLLLKITISDIRKVSGAKRFWAGAFAGRASMTCGLDLVDAAQGKTLGSYTVKGESGGSGYSGGTGDAIKKTAERIAEIIRSNYAHGD